MEKYTVSEKDFATDLRYHRELHREWKEFNKKNKIGYFQIFNNDFSKILPHLSGNAVKLYVHLGSFANSHTGECTVSVERLTKDLNCSKRAIQNWLKELSDFNLIARKQLGYKTRTHTFLLPYNQEFLKKSAPYSKIAKDIIEDAIETKNNNLNDDLF